MQNHKYGTGSVTAKGYIRISREMAHRRVLRRHYGRVPDGLFIHHIDEDKTNNDLGNLELVDPLTHKRIHSGCELREGEWWKPCRKCEEFKPVSSNYYVRKPSGISPWCKACCIRNAVENKQRRKLEAVR